MSLMSAWRSCHKNVPEGSKGKKRNDKMSYLVSCPFRPKIEMITLKKRDDFSPYSIPKIPRCLYVTGLHFWATPQGYRKFKKILTEKNPYDSG